MRRALREVKTESKLESADASYQANAATRTGRDEAREEARDKIAGQMRESFGALAQAAVAKSATLDSNTATIAALTATSARLTETNGILVAALASKTTGTPPARTPLGLAPPTSPDMTGHHTNASGNSCPTRKYSADGRWNFVTKQFCQKCNNMVSHVPANCPQLPGNEHIKVEMERYRAKRAARVAARAAARAAGTPPG